MRAAILTISSSRAQDGDRSGDELERFATELGGEVVARELIPDDREKIAERLSEWSQRCELILTTGGTGCSPNDVTPEATREVIERDPRDIRSDAVGFSRPHRPLDALAGPPAAPLMDSHADRLARGVRFG